MKNISLSSRSTITENRKGHKPHKFIHSHIKDKDGLPSYQNLSPIISTEIYTKNQSDGRPSQEYLDILGLAQGKRYRKEGNQRDIKNEH